MKAKVDQAGKYAKPVNPHENRFTGGAYNSGHSKEYWDFDKANPLLPLTKDQEPNSIVEVEDKPVCQYKNWNEEWVSTSPKYVNDAKDKYQCEIRRALKPITIAKGLNLGKLENEIDNLIAGQTAESYNEALDAIAKSDEVESNDNVDYKKAYEDLLYQVKQNISYLNEKASEYEATNHDDELIKYGFKCKMNAYLHASSKLIKSLQWLGIIK